MKKLFTLLSLFLCFASGAWAINTNGAMNGVFSVSSTKKVVFSQGNLQYVGTWQFAENQWDCFSTSQSDNHRDLFGWGTGDAPNKVSSNDGDYDTFTDWGTNAITNGGNTENSGWRTLTKDEWVYLFYTRENASTLFGFGNVAGVNGLIILPDDWKTPEGASFTASTTLGLTDLGIYYHNANNDNYTHNTYTTAEQWAVMESAGAVFLPAAAYRHWDSNIHYTGLGGFYWSSTPSSTDRAYYLNFYYNDLDPQFNEMRYGGRPVRLVKDYQLQQDAEGNYLLGSVQDWKDFAAIINNGTNPAANAKMTADIDLSTDQTMIGSYATRYSGTFDGQGHTLTFNYNTSSMSIESGQSYLGAAPFRDIEGATIRNLRTAGSITADKIGASGLVGWAYGTNTIENCWSDVNIASSNNTADTFTGFVAFMYGTSINITDCIFTGRIQSTCKKSHSGFIGYHYSGTSALTNCLVILDEGSDTNQYDSWLITFFTFDRFASSDQSAGTYTNCYYYRDFGVAQGTKATAAQLSDGTIAYKLQNRRGDLVWGQRIGTDTEPVLTNDENYRVYRSKNGGYTNDPEEAYEDIQQDEEGNYLLGSVQDWKDFAGIVNTYPAANAKMTADIDLGDDQTHIGDNNDLSYAYRGVFDGQGHKLNVNYYSSSSSTDVEGGYSIAPFRNINGATIKNLAVTGNITGYMHCAGVVGYAVSSSTNLINNVTVSANITILNTHGGGFIGHNENATTTTIQDCLFNGTINGKSGGSTVGVFFGWSKSSATMSLINCLENGSYTNCSTFTPTSCPGYAVPTVTNCYYAVTGSYPGTHATSTTLADGTIATALQNGREEEVWVQDLITNQPMLEIFANKISYKVPSSGIGTFSTSVPVVLPEGLEAYVCKTYDSGKSTISTQKVEGIIPANTGVLMKGTGGETYILTASSQTPEAIEGNALIAVVEATHVDQTVGEYTNFMMSGGKFVKIAASSNPDDKMPANRAYLPILTSALPAGSGQSITLNWDEETGVKAVRDAKFKVHSYYTLDGRRLNGAPSKGGVYINNGKKVIK